MTQVELETAVQQIAESVFEVDAKAVGDRGNPVEDLGATSITKIEFLVALERQVDPQFDIQEIELAGAANAVAVILGKRLQG